MKLEPRRNMWKAIDGSNIRGMTEKCKDNFSFSSFSTTKSNPQTFIPTTKDPDFGTAAITKIFYEGKNSGNGHYDWVDTPPRQLNKKVAKAHDRVAIKVFKIKDSTQETVQGRTPLKVHMIHIQSSILLIALKGILEEVNEFVEITESAVFMAPFKPFFFSYDKIVKLCEKTEPTGLLKQHLQLLCQVMLELFGGIMNNIKHLRSSGLISYKLAWTYFPRDTLVFCGSEDCTRVCRVVDTEYEAATPCSGPKLAIQCQQIAFNGVSFEWSPISVYIPAFSGNLPITALPNYPFSFHPDQEGVRARLTKRGREVIEYQDLTYSEYEGIAILVSGGKALKHNVSGRVLIDYYGYQKHHEGLARQGLNEEDGEKSKDEVLYTKTLPKKKQEANIKEMVSRGSDLIFVSPMLKGFSLKNKLWLNFYVDDIKAVRWNDEAYDHLVYDEGQKDLVLTFVENHQRMKSGVDDVIMGKGQGLITLLSGPPGTGKTLTAEAVADKTRRPLYYLQAEDLGTDPAKLGPRIKKVFEMATEWNAVILLDEADVFMAERSPADIARNELVSIFLRELEYFRGIIFLTTNLYNTIDIAFRSRVNIHLLFSPLPASSRLLLWQKFLSRLPEGEVARNLSEEDMRELAKWELNGREIKNAVKTVRTWCLLKGLVMELGRLESGVLVTRPGCVKVEE